MKRYTMHTFGDGRVTLKPTTLQGDDIVMLADEVQVEIDAHVAQFKAENKRSYRLHEKAVLILEDCIKELETHLADAQYNIKVFEAENKRIKELEAEVAKLRGEQDDAK